MCKESLKRCPTDDLLRDLKIAAAGRHNLIIEKRGGADAEAAARILPRIMPAVDASGDERPFCTAKPEMKLSELVGGGKPVRYGLVTAADNGVLMLEDADRFSRSALAALRHPSILGSVTIARADGVFTFPSRFTMVAAVSPCPRGRYDGTEGSGCCCKAQTIARCRERALGPLNDRFDMRIELDPQRFVSTSSPSAIVALAAAYQEVAAAWEFKRWRERDEKASQGGFGSQRIVDACRFGDAEKQVFEELSREAKPLGDAALVSLLSVARTIADLDQREAVTLDDVRAAKRYRR